MRAERKKLNRFNTPGPFLQRKDLTPEQIKGVELQNKAFDLAEEGDYSLGVEIGIFPESVLKKNKKQNTSN